MAASSPVVHSGKNGHSAGFANVGAFARTYDPWGTQLQEMTLRYFLFRDPAMLQSVAAMIVGNDASFSSYSSSPNLKWHFDYCKFHPDMISIWEDIVKSEKAKSMRVSLRLDKDHCGVL